MFHGAYGIMEVCKFASNVFGKDVGEDGNGEGREAYTGFWLSYC
jgi:hypothetical protein